MTNPPDEYRPDREIDTLALTVVLTRLIQVISGALLSLAEHRVEVDRPLGANLCALADETEWVSQVVRKAALPKVGRAESNAVSKSPANEK